MDWRILMCATRSCLRAKLNNLGKCVVTTAQHTPISVFVCLPALCYIHPQFWSKCLSNMARSFSSDRCWLMQFSTRWQNFIFLWSSQNCNPGFINYTYSHQSSFIYWSFAWVKQGKHNVKPFLITEGACLCVCMCVSDLCVRALYRLLRLYISRPHLPNSSVMAWVVELQRPKLNLHFYYSFYYCFY